METKYIAETMMRLSEQGFWRVAMDNLPGNDVALLSVLLQNQNPDGEKGLRMSRISALMGISKPAATQAVERLCRKGYAARITGADRRCVCITVTEAGEEYYRCRKAEAEALTERVLSHMREKDALEFGRLLTVFGDALRAETVLTSTGR